MSGHKAVRIVASRIAVIAAAMTLGAMEVGARSAVSQGAGQTDRVQARSSPQANVVIEPDASSGAIRYRIVEGGCQIAWTTHVSKGIIEHRPDCPGPFALQVGPLSRLAAAVFADRVASGKLQTIFIGGFTALPELSARLASEASRSSGWDAVSGQPRTGLLNTYVATLIQEGSTLEEWRQVFAAVGKKVNVSSVEQAQVSAAGDLPFYGLLRKAGVEARARVPYNAIVWLSLTSSN